jgi:hypothetical protein
MPHYETVLSLIGAFVVVFSCQPKIEHRISRRGLPCNTPAVMGDPFMAQARKI